MTLRKNVTSQKQAIPIGLSEAPFGRQDGEAAPLVAATPNDRRPSLAGEMAPLLATGGASY